MKKQEKVIFAHDNQWGKKYQIKKLSRGLIRNYLLSKILFCNKKNLTWAEKQKEIVEKREETQTVEYQKLYEKVNNFTLFFTINKDKKGNTLGSVREKDILTELTKLDKNLKKNQLIDFQPLRELGKNLVKIKIKNDLTAYLNIVID